MSYDVGFGQGTALAAVGVTLASPDGGHPTCLAAFAGAALDSRITVLAPGALELACALMRQGYTDVSIARCCDRPPHLGAGLVFVPNVSSAAVLERAVACARGMLAPGGVIAVSLGMDVASDAAEQVLLQQGFGTVQLCGMPAATVIRAELAVRSH